MITPVYEILDEHETNTRRWPHEIRRGNKAINVVINTRLDLGIFAKCARNPPGSRVANRKFTMTRGKTREGVRDAHDAGSVRLFRLHLFLSICCWWCRFGGNGYHHGCYRLCNLLFVISRVYSFESVPFCSFALPVSALT